MLKDAKKICKAKLRHGERCHYEAVLDGYCLTHFKLHTYKKIKEKKDEEEVGV